MPLEIENIYISDINHSRYVDDGVTIEINGFEGFLGQSINSDQAQQIIKHLQEQFSLNP